MVRLRRRSVLRDRLVRLSRSLRLCRSSIVLAQQASEKAGSVRGLQPLLLRLLNLLLQLPDLRLGLVEGDVLHQHRLGKNIQGVGIGAQFMAEQIFGVGIFLLQFGLVDPLDERI